MSTVVNVKNLLDPELRPVLDRVEMPTVDAEGVAAMRSASFVSPDLSAAVVRTEHEVPGDPSVPVRVHRAKDAQGLQAAVVTIHGGGYVIGSSDMDSPLLDRWCPAWVWSASPWSTASHPRRRTPARSTTATPRCAGPTTTPRELGIDKDRIGLYGLSAGGGLAATLALLARDRGEVPLAFVVLDCPMLDDRQQTPLWRGRRPLRVGLAGQRVRLALLPRRGCYGSDDVPSYAAASREGDLTGLPPTSSSSARSTGSVTRTSRTPSS